MGKSRRGAVSPKVAAIAKNVRKHLTQPFDLCEIIAGGWDWEHEGPAMRGPKQKRGYRRFIVPLYLAVAAGALVATDLLDAWVVPFTDRPYAVYRQEFLGELKEHADIDLEGSLSLAGELDLGGWVGR